MTNPMKLKPFSIFTRDSGGTHPDRPGWSHDRMAAVSGARDEGLAALIGPAA